MGWFCLSWIIIVSAISVSCQELTTLLPQDDDACMRNEVTFTCTIRGSQNQTSLILVWRSLEYIGNRNVFRFLSIDMPGTNTTSTINGNVTAILTNNAVIGVPELVSELHIIGANLTSVVTCESVTSGRSASTTFDSSAFPGRPQGGEAREVSAGSCDFLVTWDPPTNIERSDIDRYIIYVPSRNMMNVSLSDTIDLTVPNCGVGNNSIQVAAVNRLGCVGPNSSLIQLSFLEMQVVTVTGPLRFRLATAAIAGIAVGVAAFVIVVLAVIVAIGCTAYWMKAKQQHQNDKENFEKNLKNLIGAIRKIGSAKAETATTATMTVTTIVPLEQTLALDLLEMMEKMPPSDIKEALKTVLLDTKVTSANGIKAVLLFLRPSIRSIFDKELRKAESSVTMDKFIEPVEKGEHQRRRDELIKQVDNASPETVKHHLKTLLEVLNPQGGDGTATDAF